MRLRNVISVIIYGGGAALGLAGLIMLQAGTSIFHAMMFVVAAITLMCGGVIYMLATDDLESRDQMLPDEARIDLRSRPGRAREHEPVHA
jgi:hypothetical protein